MYNINIEMVRLEFDETSVSWDGSGTCCEFHYNGLPTNPLVSYNWCGGCLRPPTSVSSFDTYCQTHACVFPLRIVIKNKKNPIIIGIVHL